MCRLPEAASSRFKLVTRKRDSAVVKLQMRRDGMLAKLLMRFILSSWFDARSIDVEGRIFKDYYNNEHV
jgi:hypothetical protein